MADIPGLLGKLAGLPSAITQGLLGPLPQTSLGLDPAQMEQARQSALTDMAYGMLAGSTAPGWRNQMGTVAVARQNALGNYQQRVFDVFKEQELNRAMKEREQRKAEEDKYLSGLPAEVQPIARVAGPQSVAQAQIQAAMTPSEQPWRVLSDEEEAKMGLDPSLMYKTNGTDIETIGGRPPAPAIGNLNLGAAQGLPDYLKERQKSISGQLAEYEKQADTSFGMVQRFDALIEQSRKTKLTGAFAPGVMGTAEFLRSFGIELAPEALTDARTLDSMINQSHMQWVASLGGARGMTDSENKKLAQALLRIQDSPSARVEVVKTLRDAEKRKYDEARKAAKRKENQLLDIEGGGKGFTEFEDLPDTPQAPQYMEGDTATNPKTGEKVIFRGGRWVKVSP